MATKLKRIREQQLLSIEFISSVINVEPNLYKQFEDGCYVLEKEKSKLVYNLLGIETSDLVDESININLPPSGRARFNDYNDITQKDLKELCKLMAFGKEIEESFAWFVKF